eukprot:COSAG01_NODE_14288_length_1472_cov_2.316096_1_plen_125_part_00
MWLPPARCGGQRPAALVGESYTRLETQPAEAGSHDRTQPLLAGSQDPATRAGSQNPAPAGWEKREGSAADCTRADREETQVRSKEQRATLSRAGSMRRKPPAPNEFQERAALASAGLSTSFTSR